MGSGLTFADAAKMAEAPDAGRRLVDFLEGLDESDERNAAISDYRRVLAGYGVVAKMLLASRTEPAGEPFDPLAELEAAWGIIANAGNGDWGRETTEWQDAAARWRDRVMPTLSTWMARRESAG